MHRVLYQQRYSIPPSLTESHLGDDVRVDSEDYDEGRGGVREECVDGVQHRQHFLLLAAVKPVHDGHQTRLLLAEGVQTLHLENGGVGV